MAITSFTTTTATAAEPRDDGSALFDAYMVVDWSAAGQPKTGRDSIWFTLYAREGGRLRRKALENPATREAATAAIGDRLAALAGAGLRVLVGFDFPFGYPTGTARRLGLEGKPWRATWELLATAIEDDGRNRNNRFDVAEELNRRLSGEAFPFWGNVREERRAYLLRRDRRPHERSDLAEQRFCDRRVPSAKPVWQLAGAGSVGSQVLTGLPRVWQLRNDPRLCEVSAIWPFETGLAHDGKPRVIFAEVYPSLFEAKPIKGKPKDAAQVVGTARGLAALDDARRLADLFTADPSFTVVERKTVEHEEGWMLGVAERPAVNVSGWRDYLRNPLGIYRLSRELVLAEANLSRIPAELREVALRLVHASGEPGIIATLRASTGAAAAGRRALDAGALVLTDSEMVAHGIIRSTLPANNQVECALNAEGVTARARRLTTTRSAAAVDLWGERLAGTVVAIGNAPTALFRLLELLEGGAPRPALIVAMPVGFVGAADSKLALIKGDFGVPYIVLTGRRGGSALAAATINALVGRGPL